MTSYRSTTLNLVDRHCPGALDHYEAGVPYDRDVYAAGIAAHAFIQSAIEGVDLDVTARSLAVNGRSFDGIPEPVLPPGAIVEGRTLADRWLAENPVTTGERAEIGMGVAEDLVTAAPYATSYVRCIYDVIHVTDEDQGDGYHAVQVVRTRDWKSAWPTDASELDTLQFHIQAVVAVANHPKATILRREAVNLRTRAVYSTDLFLDDAGMATIETWRQEIRLAIAQASTSPRPFRPGVGCLGCPYLIRCPAARRYYDGTAFDGTPENIATTYAVVDALKAKMTPAIKALAAESPITIPGGIVGFATKTQRKYLPGSADRILAAWTESPASLIETIAPGSRSIDKIATKIHPYKRGEGSDYKDRRAEFAASTLTTKTVTAFGCHRATDPTTTEDDSE